MKKILLLLFYIIFLKKIKFENLNSFHSIPQIKIDEKGLKLIIDETTVICKDIDSVLKSI